MVTNLEKVIGFQALTYRRFSLCASLDIYGCAGDKESHAIECWVVQKTTNTQERRGNTRNNKFSL